MMIRSVLGAASLSVLALSVACGTTVVRRSASAESRSAASWVPAGCTSDVDVYGVPKENGKQPGEVYGCSPRNEYSDVEAVAKALSAEHGGLVDVEGKPGLDGLHNIAPQMGVQVNRLAYQTTRG